MVEENETGFLALGSVSRHPRGYVITTLKQDCLETGRNR